MKVLIILCVLAAAKAGVIGTDYAPAPVVSTVYSSLNGPAVNFSPHAYTKILAAPAPAYGSVLSTHETRTKGLDGTQHNTFAKTLNTPYSSIQKFDSRSTNEGFVSHSIPVYSNAQVLSHPHTTYSVAAPVVHHVSSPVTYSAHTGPYVTKTISTPAVASFSAPVLTKTVSPSLTSYTAHTPVVAQPAVKITYSEAPLVSHMTFTGLGTSYSW